MVELADDERWSYTASKHLGAVDRGRELYELFRYAVSSVDEQVERAVGQFHELRRIVEDLAGALRTRPEDGTDAVVALNLTSATVASLEVFAGQLERLRQVQPGVG